ncbi:MAG: IS30 family transposase [Acidimicrobiales bacterium]
MGGDRGHDDLGRADLPGHLRPRAPGPGGWAPPVPSPKALISQAASPRTCPGTWETQPVRRVLPHLTRPPSAEDRKEPGHWEGDLIIGARCRSAIVTLAERKSRLNLLGELPEGHDAESTLACLVELFDPIPEGLRRSLTWNQGREMARHHELSALGETGSLACGLTSCNTGDNN